MHLMSPIFSECYDSLRAHLVPQQSSEQYFTCLWLLVPIAIGCYNVPISPKQPQTAQQLCAGSGTLMVSSQVGAIQSVSNMVLV